MKKFTLFAASALLTLSVSAASVKVAPHHAKAESLKNRTERMSDKQANKLRAQGKTLIDASKIRKAPAKEEEQEATIVSSAMVTEQPAGTLSTWSRNCDSYWTFWGFLIHEQVVGSAQQMVDGEDGKLWLNGILSQ